MDVRILGNLVGTDSSGTAPIPNVYEGIKVSGSSASDKITVSGNTVSGNLTEAVTLASASVTVSDNMIGAASAAQKADGMGNAYTGLILDNVRKGTVTGNTIAGNGSAGMYLQNSANLVLTGNRVGTDPTGEVSVGNNYVGINTCNLEDSRIGGSTPSERNILSGNNNSGISLDCDSEENVVRGNYIGRGADGSTSIPNGTSGIYLSSNSDRNVIGGNDSGAGNLIAGNGARGVGVSPGAQGNAIWGNSIFDNGQLGIDLNDDVTVNANDSDDTDVGGNNLQNFPVLTQAGSDGSGTVVKGKPQLAPGPGLPVGVLRQQHL